MKKPHLLILGCGYSGLAIAKLALANGFGVSATKRPDSLKQIKEHEHINYFGFDASFIDDKQSQDLKNALFQATHLLISLPATVQEKQGDKNEDIKPDLFIQNYHDVIANWLNDENSQWVGYLSTTGVYGNHDGAWVDEDTPPQPSMRRTKQRLKTEQAWQDLCTAAHKKTKPLLTIFRLAGIYGPGRNAIESLKKGRVRRIIKKGQYFSRIHLDDIAQIVMACLNFSLDEKKRNKIDGIFNLADDEPAPPQDVITYAAKLINHPLPPAIDFDKADISPMARSFYLDNKRIKNDKVKQVLDITLIHPTYKQALKDLVK